MYRRRAATYTRPREPPPRRHRILPGVAIIIAALLVGLDQLTKYLVASNMELGASVPLGLGFALTHSRNTGAAFGLLRDLNIPLGGVTIDGTFLLGVLSAAVSLGLLIYLLRNGARLGALTATALGLVLAGAAGNMIDRFRLGYVVDFIHFRVGWFDFPVFNVADSCVVIGAALLVLASFLGERREQRAAQAANGASGADFKRGPGPRQHVLDDMPEVPPLPPRGQGDQE